MKLWIDDVRPAPQGYEWVKSVNRAKVLIKTKPIEIIDNEPCWEREYEKNYPAQ